jgi:glycosyltransferase involved in cell wall biosynthesis
MIGNPWGGSEYLWSQAALRLAKNGTNICANVFRWPEVPEEIQALRRAGCRLTRRTNPQSLKKRILRKLLDQTEYLWLDLVKPDLVVISQGGNCDDAGWLWACIKRQLPFVVITHAILPHRIPHSHFGDAYRRAKAVFFVSRSSLELMQLQLTTLFTKAKVIWNPFNVNYHVHLPWPSTEPTFKLACVAQLNPSKKGQDILFVVLNQEKWRRRPIEITLFGDGNRRKYLEELKQLLKVEHIAFRGFVRDVESIWAEHHALILPSRIEGMPLTLVEAMLCGRPCIVTDVGGNTELIEDNVSGFVACAPNKECVDEAMERAWARRREWQIIGEAAARRVRAVVPPDPVADFIKELHRYANLVET